MTADHKADAVSRVTKPAEFKGIQVLRALAACMVVVYHSTQIWSQHVDDSRSIWLNARHGVDVFFVISGFVMFTSSASKPHQSHAARTFLERRFVRIAPMYWLVTLLFVLKAGVVALRPALMHAGPHAQMTVPFVLASLLFIPYTNSSGVVMPVLIVGWTLEFEMFFYLLFAAALALRVRLLPALSVTLAVLAVVGYFRNDSWPAITFVLNPLLLEFVAGMWIAAWVQRGGRVALRTAIGLGAVALLALLLAPVDTLPWGPAVFGVAATALVLSSLGLEALCRKPAARVLLWVGDASYSIYLIHLLVYSLLLNEAMRLHLLEAAHGHLRESIMAVVYTTVAVLAGLALYRWVEAPVNNALRDWMHLRSARRQPQPL